MTIQSQKQFDVYRLIVEEASRIDCPVYFMQPLSKYTTWRIGGPADILIEPNNIEQLTKLVMFARINNVPHLIIGGGSNLLVSDSGVRGVVFHIGPKLSQIQLKGKQVVIDAGTWVPSLARKVGSAGLSGFEHLIGIPGTLGGLLVMNGGSRRENVGTRVVSIQALSPQGIIISLKNEECHFGYRSSIFQSGDFVILQATVELDQKNSKEIRRDMLSIMRERRSKFPIKMASCGSVFLSNPSTFNNVGPPGKLIEEAGLKGFTVGRAQVSNMHANFIVNLEQATCSDTLQVIGEVKKRVKEKTGVILKCEVRYLDESCRISDVPERD